MPPLWQWDQDLFRAIHSGLHRAWLDPYVKAVTFSGLGYVQGCACVVSIYDRKVGAWATGIILLFMAFCASVIEQSAPAFVAMLMVGFGALFIDRQLIKGALLSLVASGLLRLAYEPLVDRQRPSNLPFSHPLEDVHGFSSFPSGHATTTFAIAAFLCWGMAKTPASSYAWIAVGWAILVGFSRVYVGVHYPLDIVGAALFGVAIGSLVYFLFRVKGWLTVQPVSEPIERNLS